MDLYRKTATTAKSMIFQRSSHDYVGTGAKKGLVKNMLGNLRTISTPKDPLALFRCLAKNTAEVKKPGVPLFHLLLPLPFCTNLI